MHLVAAFLAGFACVCTLAKLTVDHTDVRIVDVAIDVVVSEVPVQPFTEVIREPSNRNDIVRSIQFNTVIQSEPLVPEYLVADCVQIPHTAENYTKSQPRDTERIFIRLLTRANNFTVNAASFRHSTEWPLPGFTISERLDPADRSSRVPPGNFNNARGTLKNRLRDSKHRFLGSRIDFSVAH